MDKRIQEDKSGIGDSLGDYSQSSRETPKYPRVKRKAMKS